MNGDECEIAARVKEVADKVEKLNETLGRVANVVTPLSIMMWEGKERRVNPFVCQSHMELVDDIKKHGEKIDRITEVLGQVVTNTEVTKTNVLNLDRRINGALDSVANHIEAGSRWRLAIMGMCIGLVVSIITAAYWYGTLSNAVSRNTEILKRYESGEKH